MKSKEYLKYSERKEVPPSRYRVGMVVVIIALVILYTIAIIAGIIPEGRRIDLVNLAVITLAAICAFLLMHPRAFDRLKMLEMRGFKLEMLEKVREKQAEQESQLEDIRLILPLLLPEAEQKHLLNLAEGKTQEYDGSSSLRAELRRLRSLRLIESLPDIWIGHIEDDSKVDLANYVKLTNLGERWVRRIKEIERVEAQDEP